METLAPSSFISFLSHRLNAHVQTCSDGFLLLSDDLRDYSCALDEYLADFLVLAREVITVRCFPQECRYDGVVGGAFYYLMADVVHRQAQNFVLCLRPCDAGI